MSPWEKALHRVIANRIASHAATLESARRYARFYHVSAACLYAAIRRNGGVHLREELDGPLPPFDPQVPGSPAPDQAPEPGG